MDTFRDTCDGNRRKAWVETLVEQYMPLARKIAYAKKRTLPNFIDAEDLVSSAYLGLVEAASRFDETRGKFSTYAYSRINGAIYDYLREQKWDKPIIEVAISNKVSHEEMLEVAGFGLEKQSQDILRYYFIEQYSMKEIGDLTGVTEGRISQKINDYMARLRRRYGEDELQALLAA